MIREVPPGGDIVSGAIDLYTYLMFGFLLLGIIAFFSIIVWVLGLPGKIALQRKHPHAETVKIMGWAGALAVIPWIHAFIWAFHDSLTIDIRRFPTEEKKAIEDEIARLSAEEGKTTTVEIDKPTRLPDPPAAA